MEFNAYLIAIGHETASAENLTRIVDDIRNNRVQLNNDYFVKEATSIKAKASMLYALKLLVSYQNYLAFKQFSEPRHSYPLALLYASKLYRTVPMMVEETIFEINDVKKIENLYQHALAYQEIAGGIYDISGIVSYGRKKRSCTSI